ncbi:hypothetical protein E4U47_000766 [Claviceps purpurea]|nr:hypothetical protein E4U47_000766 [Claviceps purpurea]
MSNEAGPSNTRRMLSDTELDDTTSEPSKRRRMPPTTELEDTASEGSTRQCTRCSHILPVSHFASARRTSVLTKNCVRCRNHGRQARASITGLQTRPLRNKNAAGHLIETTAHPGHYGVMEENQFR